jgi:hypothetical protein
VSAQPRTAAEARFLAAYDQLLTHGAECAGCRGPVDGAESRTCPEGHRLFDEHQQAKRGLRPSGMAATTSALRRGRGRR